ncbi:uncharacterized protein [Leuresthes tenuis]|uniref:uncharacterized protein isoform X2 n=1 Tax=Leuresthes tenuis TaxID=355514 RepID=UPI003B501EEB
MIGGLAAFILLSTLAVIQALEVPHQISLTEAVLGDNVTLICTVFDKPGLFYWYKLDLGYMFQTVAQGSFDKIELQGQFNNTRFNATKLGNTYPLIIRNVSKEDEASYFCQAGAAYKMGFINSTYLAVNDPENKQKTIYVKQAPEKKQVPEGNYVNLDCSFLSKCPGERKVFWYRAGSESNPGIIYTGNFSCDKQAGGSCVSRLSKIIENRSSTGTYYCAVVTCGKILFGDGTPVEIKQEYPHVTVLGTLLACCAFLNIIAFLILIRRRQKPVCEHCKGDPTASNVEQVGSAGDQLGNLDGEDVGLNYVALDFPARKAKRWKNKRELPEDCTYSYTRNYQ